MSSIPEFSELPAGARQSAVHLETRDTYRVSVRRARVVSEPVTQYIRWEHYVTHSNVAAGEQVRWLSRRDAIGVLLPANDFWIFDGRLMRVHHFSGDGDWTDKELRHGMVPERSPACFVRRGTSSLA